MLGLDFKEIVTIGMVLFAVIDIVGSIPLLISLKEKMGGIRSTQATLISGALMILFLFAGEAFLKILGLAEREGFEPSVMLPPRLISSQVHSTTLPPLLHSPLRLVTAANSISSLSSKFTRATR